MSDFKSAWAFIRYTEVIRTEYRFVHPPSVSDFLRTLVETSHARIRNVPVGLSLWRAQLGRDVCERRIDDSDITIVVEDQVPFSSERMKPRRNAANEGRVNPKGIPCLYVATDKETAMSEVRPWIGARVSVGDFQTTCELKLVDFSQGHDYKFHPDLLLGNPKPSEVLESVWAQVDRAFSEPVADDLSTADYAPTQVIAETFRREGFDGLVYKSALSSGFNMALFDLDAAELRTCSLFRTEKLAFEFKYADEAYTRKPSP